MRTVNMTVIFCVNVPDGTNVDDLTIDIDDYATLTLGCVGTREQVGGRIVSHETTVCEELHGQAAE